MGKRPHNAFPIILPLCLKPDDGVGRVGGMANDQKHLHDMMSTGSQLMQYLFDYVI